MILLLLGEPREKAEQHLPLRAKMDTKRHRQAEEPHGQRACTMDRQDTPIVMLRLALATKGKIPRVMTIKALNLSPCILIRKAVVKKKGP